MRLGLRIAVVAAAFVALAAGTGAKAASATTTCTWGGTPAAPTGTFTISPGQTNNPSPVPMKFTATGPLAGGPGCSGTFSFNGYFNTGSSCLLDSGAGVATGIPGVVRYGGIAPVEPGAFPPVWLYNGRGQIVGSEQPNVLTDYLLNQANACNTPQGLTSGRFDSLVELFGAR
jgi:hypothetical protein